MVMRLIGQAHTMLHEQGIVRIQSDIRVGSRSVCPFFKRMLLLREIPDARTDKSQTMEKKVNAVEEILAATQEKV